MAARAKNCLSIGTQPVMFAAPLKVQLFPIGLPLGGEAY